MDMRTEGVDARQAAKRGSGRKDKDKDKDDGAKIELQPLRDALKHLGDCARKAAEAAQVLKEAVKAIAEKSGLNASTVRRMVKAHSLDFSGFENEKRKVEQLGIVFDEIAYAGEITKAAEAEH